MKSLFVCRFDHALYGPMDDTGQIWCNRCKCYMTARDPDWDDHGGSDFLLAD